MPPLRTELHTRNGRNVRRLQVGVGLESKLVLLDDIIDEEEPLKLCPSCKAAYIGMDEDMCENCLARASQQVSDDIDEDNDDWRTYLDDEDTTDPADDDTVIPLEELDEDDDDDGVIKIG